VSKDHDHFGSQHGGAKLEAAQPFGCHEIAGDADDEQFTRPLIECELGRYSGIGASQYGGKRLLALSARRAACRKVALVQLPGDIARIAGHQFSKGGVRRVGGSRRLSASTAHRCCRREGPQSYRKSAATRKAA
jgi:hypothetical protein